MTGATAIQNASGDTVSFERYSIRSNSSNLNGGDTGWASLADQLVPGWAETNGADNHLAEMSPIAFELLDDQEIPLGRPFTYQPNQFGDSPAEGLSFQYGVSGAGTANGLIEYSGPENTLALTVDPNSGEAVLHNESPFDVAINGYTVASENGTLLPSSWNSFADREIGDWDEANPSNRHLSELNPAASMTIHSGVALRLGQLFDATRENDLRLHFQRVGDGREFDGVVRTETVADPLRGDFNGDGQLDEIDIDILSVEARQEFHNPLFDLTNDGLVDQSDRAEWVIQLKGTMFGDANFDLRIDDADFAIVRDHLYVGDTGWAAADFNGDGLTDVSDFNLWNANRGFLVAAAVPEPMACHLAWLSVAAVLFRARPRRNATTEV